MSIPSRSIRELTGGNGADVVFDCAGGSPKQGLAGTHSLMQAIDAVRSGGKLIGVSWFTARPLESISTSCAKRQPALALSRYQHA